jgi:hypothetical protein
VKLIYKGTRTPVTRIFSDSINSAIERIYADAQMEFAFEALRIVMEAFKSNIPIDTETLKRSITGRAIGNVARIEIPSAILHYDDHHIHAKKLGAILEFGLSRKGKILMRTKSNKAPMAKQGTPTAGWWTQSIDAAIPELNELAKKVVAKANKKVQRIISGVGR